MDQRFCRADGISRVVFGFIFACKDTLFFTLAQLLAHKKPSEQEYYHTN